VSDPTDGFRAPGKRGRRQALPDPTGGPVAEFAHALATMKVGAGDPSYDRMRGELGAMASKSALSAAARGRELPSWETTWEFVRSLTPPGTDLEPVRQAWRERWEAARSTDPAPSAVPPPPPASPAPDEPRTAASSRRRDRRFVVLGLIVGATVGGVLWGLIAAGSPPAPPIDGDASGGVADVTVPDGSLVPAGELFVKTWEFRNAGTVRWSDRFLERIPGAEGTACRTPDRVPVPPTEPGATVQVSVEVEAPPGPVTCKVYWKMVDEQGRAYFPKLRPVFFEVVVR
jgi:hypothetical protein